MSADGPQTLVATGLVTRTALDKAAARSCVCRVTAGPDVGTQLSVGGRAVVVGSHPACDLILADPKVSRRHLQLQTVPEGLRVRDLESKNGSFVEGVRVTDAIKPLRGTGAVSIQLGDTTLRVQHRPGPTVEPSRRTRFGGLVGESLQMREVFAVLERASPADVTVLLEGESGTGKELAARAIHDHSPRAEHPFVIIDCSALSTQLVESHLFGHLAGAFTGAAHDRRGAFVEAHKGTLFLDEIGELAPEAQSRLLRALEARTVQPVGADQPISVDTRVIAATHRDLCEMVDAEQFRFDLFHRLSVVHIVIPPLRERLEDLPSLIRLFYESRSVDPGPLAGATLERFKGHRWPGNARELRNVLERSWVLGGAVPFAELEAWFQTHSRPNSPDSDLSLPFKEAKQVAIEAFERQYLAALMQRYGDNLSRASDHAGINRRHLKKLLEDHRLRPPS